MTFIMPTLTSSTTPTLSWNSTTTTNNDQAGEYDIRLNVANPSTATIPIRIGVGTGTGIYDFDWKIVSAIGNGSVVDFPLPPGQTSVSVRVLVNENLDAPDETHILVLQPGTGYHIGANATHTTTCSLGATKPSASNTGYSGSTQDHAGGTYDTPQQFDKKNFTGGVTLRTGASGSTFTKCKFSHSSAFAYSLQMKGANGCTFDDCTFTATNEANITSSHVFMFSGLGSSGNIWTRCLFEKSGHDSIKLEEGATAAGGNQFIGCYFHHIGLLAPEVPTVHGDQIQVHPAGTAGCLFYNCFFDWAVVENDAWAGGASSNSVFIMENDPGFKNRNLVLASCWCLGGNATFDAAGENVGCWVKNCRIGNRLGVDCRYLLLQGSFADQLNRSGNKEYTSGEILIDLANNLPFNNREAF